MREEYTDPLILFTRVQMGNNTLKIRPLCREAGEKKVLTDNRRGEGLQKLVRPFRTRRKQTET